MQVGGTGEEASAFVEDRPDTTEDIAEVNKEAAGGHSYEGGIPYTAAETASWEGQ